MQEGEAESPFLQTVPLGVYCLVEVGTVEERVPPHSNSEGCLAQFLAAVSLLWLRVVGQATEEQKWR